MAKKRELLQLMETSPEEQARQISKAKAVIKEYLQANPGKRAGVYFSCGKDSLLTALLAVEVSEELGIERPALFTSFVPYEIETEKIWNKYLINNISGVDWLGVEPPPFYHFSCTVYGVGTLPPVMQVVKWCNSKYKQKPLDFLIRENKKDFIFFTGVRAEESSKRARRFIEQGYYIKNRNYVTPIIEVKEATLWEYLKHNLYKLGIDYNNLCLQYQNKTRGGCFFCINDRVKRHGYLEAEIVNKLRSYFFVGPGGVLLPFKGDELKDGKERTRRLQLYCVKDKKERNYRTRLCYCKQWYNDLLELQKKYGRELLGETDKKIIKEIWNWRELFNERITQKDFLESYFNGSYKPLYPELFDIVFYKRGNRYCYIPGVIKQIR